MCEVSTRVSQVVVQSGGERVVLGRCDLKKPRYLSCWNEDRISKRNGTMESNLGEGTT